jgi:hypothetical protein
MWRLHVGFEGLKFLLLGCNTMQFTESQLTEIHITLPWGLNKKLSNTSAWSRWQALLLSCLAFTSILKIEICSYEKSVDIKVTTWCIPEEGSLRGGCMLHILDDWNLIFTSWLSNLKATKWLYVEYILPLFLLIRLYPVFSMRCWQALYHSKAQTGKRPWHRF